MDFAAVAPDLLLPLLDAMPARAAVVGLDWRCLHANHELLQFLQLPRGQAIGRDIAELVGAQAFEAYRSMRERLLRGESARWEGWTDHSGIGPRYLQEHVLPHQPERGATRAFIVLGRDLTDLKRREAELAARVQQLQDSEALKSAIFDHALVALVSADVQGRIVEFNPAAEGMFGHARQSVLGRPVSEIIIPERLRGAHEAGMRRLAAQEPARVIGQRLELPALRADGSEFPVEMVLWRTDVAGTVFYTASLNDLTAQRNAALEIERQRDALRQSERLSAMGSLLAGVAHELNNPLAIVMGRATLLESKSTGQPALHDDATRIREAAERCARIVRTFLNMARQRPAERRSVQINALVRGAVDLLQYGLRTGGIALDLQLDERLPELRADGDQLGQVVLNLLVNAQQALVAAPAPRRLLLQTGHDAGPDTARLWLQVSDNGPGVDAAHRERIFEPFFTTKREGVGTGLGLSVSRSVARQHGGELGLHAGPGVLGGATFRLSLPLAPPAAAEAPAPTGTDDEPPTSRLLVVDDEPELAALMRDMLEAAGFEVACAESGAVALELLQEARFDAIVSDLRMPDMDGAALWRAVRDRTPALAGRMLFTSGDTLSPLAGEVLQATGRALLEKPFTPAELLSRVRALLLG